jgi:hypothetical protein
MSHAKCKFEIQIALAETISRAYGYIGLRTEGEENMKKHASIYLASLISLTTAVCFAGDAPVPASTPVATPAPAAVSAPAPAAPTLPYGASEVVKMYQGGINKEVLIAYVDSSTMPFHLTADQIIYLQHLGLPQEVTAAMMHRDAELQKGGMAYQPQPAPVPAPQMAPPPAGATAQVMVPGTPPPVVSPYPTVVQPVYSDYDPYYYAYPYAYPNVIVAGGWGWGWGPHGWGWGRGFDHGGFRGGFGGHGFHH